MPVLCVSLLLIKLCGVVTIPLARLLRYFRRGEYWQLMGQEPPVGVG